MSIQRQWRTLRKGGVIDLWHTEDEALAAARAFADEDGDWCGVEQKGPRGWGLLHVVHPTTTITED